MSGFVVGTEGAVADLEAAATLWKARDLVRDYLASRDAAARADLLAKLEALQRPEDPARSAATEALDLDTLARLAVAMAPPLAEEAETPGEPILHRVRDDENVEPTEYAVLLPPEYHPLRSYPAVVALHGGEGPSTAIAWWRAEARRRGYIVIAPEYNLPGQARDYRYTTSEHAAVELALRDARRRYRHRRRPRLPRRPAARRQHGLGLRPGPSRPVRRGRDRLGPAGQVRLSLPAARRAAPALRRARRPGAGGQRGRLRRLVKPLIAKAYDVTYVEYLRRGLEDLPEEAAPIFDWMDRRRRDPAPKEFEALVGPRLATTASTASSSASSSPGGPSPPRRSSRSARTSSPPRSR